MDKGKAWEKHDHWRHNTYFMRMFDAGQQMLTERWASFPYVQSSIRVFVRQIARPAMYHCCPGGGALWTIPRPGNVAYRSSLLPDSGKY